MCIRDSFLAEYIARKKCWPRRKDTHCGNRNSHTTTFCLAVLYGEGCCIWHFWAQNALTDGPSPHKFVTSKFHHVIMSSCQHIIMSSCHHAMMSSCHRAIIPSCHHEIVSLSCHRVFVIMSSYHHVIVSSRHHVIMSSSWHHAIVSSCHDVIMPSCHCRVIMSSCEDLLSRFAMSLPCFSTFEQFYALCAQSNPQDCWPVQTFKCAMCIVSKSVNGRGTELPTMQSLYCIQYLH